MSDQLSEVKTSPVSAQPSNPEPAGKTPDKQNPGKQEKPAKKLAFLPFRKKKPAMPETAPEAESAENPVTLSKPEKPEKPEKEKQQNERPKKVPKVKRNWLLRILVVLMVIAGLFYVYQRLTDISDFVISFYSFDEQKITSPIRMAFLSDLHLNEFGEDNCELVNTIADLNPDLIIVGGDMNMMKNPDTSIVLTLCRQLVEIAPVYYGMGNHEYDDVLFRNSTIIADLSALGVNVLSNKYMTIQVNGNLIDIGGLSETMDQFDQYGIKFWKKYDEGAKNYRLLLVHDPGYFRSGMGKLCEKNIDLALCGHYHGGQIVLPVIGPLYHPQGGFRPELAGGYARVGDTLVVTSRGLGNHSKLPRFNNPPELVIIDLF